MGWKMYRLGRLLAGLWGAVLVQAAVTRADEADLRQMIEAQNKQIQELKTQIEALKGATIPPQGSLDNAAVKKIAADYLKERDDKKKAEDEAKKKEEEAKKAVEEAQGYKLGTDLKINARWADTSGLTFETPNKDFTMHLGGWFQFDNVWWSQTAKTRPVSQLGDFQDGCFFRRTRLQVEGTAWEVVEFNCIPALEGVQDGIVGLDEFWVGVTKIPFIGTVRAGHLKVPQGLEGDMVSSSRAMTFLERASFTDAFFFNFSPGVWMGNSVLDQRLTWSAMWYRPERNPDAADFADGQYAGTGRLTFLPLYENDGRCLVHLGASSTIRAAQRTVAANGVIGPRAVRFRARPEQRDAVGSIAGINATTADFGDTSRLVDTGVIEARDVWVNAAEFLAIWGPLSLQSEWAFTNVENARIAGTTRGLGFNGGYIMLSYFLTGENRAYDRRLGRLATYYVKPFTPFWLVRDEDGSWNSGRGAWELAMRYSYLNLNDDPIQGGIMSAWTLGLNWYLNTNLKVQFEYIDDGRWHKTTAPNGTVPGWVQGFGCRTQLMW